MEDKYNMETLQNKYPISMYQEGPPHEPYFIVINNQEQPIIGPNKKIVATHIVGELI